MSRFFHNRRRKVAGFFLGFVLAAAVGASAALVVYDLTVNGSTSPNNITITTTHVSALTFSSNGAAPALDAGSNVLVPVKVTNNDPTVAHTVGAGMNVAVTASLPTCQSHLSVTAVTGVGNGTVVAAAGSVPGSVTVALDATTPVACSGTTYTLAFTGVASS